MILGIDPGTYSSGWALYDPRTGRVTGAGELANAEVEDRLSNWSESSRDVVAIEMIGHYGTGMAVGAEVYHTVLWIGRWLKVCESAGVAARLIRRPSIKAELCGSAKAKDGEVAQALRDLLGDRGTKKAPGPTYGVSGHAWQALAVAVAYARGVQPLDWSKTKEGR